MGRSRGRTSTARALDLVEEWAAVLEVGGGSGQRTLQEHRAHVRAVVREVAESSEVDLEDLSLSALTRPALLRALAAWRTRPDGRYTAHEGRAPTERSAASVRRRIAALRAFFSWCVEEGHLEADPAAGIRAPAAPAHLPRTLSEDVARDVLLGARLGTTPERDLLLCALLLTCGVGLKEASTLELGSLVGSPPSMVRVVGRGGDERLVTLSPLAREALGAYLPVREAALVRWEVETPRLFVSARPRTVSVRGREERRIESSYGSLGEALERVLQRAGVEEHGVRAQALRATFATLALTSGSHTVRELQEALGHQGLTGIREYARAAGADLAGPAARHPLGQALS